MTIYALLSIKSYLVYRTHSIILVDDSDSVTYYEMTMDFPIDAANPKWVENKFEFQFNTQ